ncbi:hypothetical protein ACGTN9_06710 [Halobacillus sp. MO56]
MYLPDSWRAGVKAAEKVNHSLKASKALQHIGALLTFQFVMVSTISVTLDIRGDMVIKERSSVRDFA